jgi:hypothetical protein
MHHKRFGSRGLGRIPSSLDICQADDRSGIPGIFSLQYERQTLALRPYVDP